MTVAVVSILLWAVLGTSQLVIPPGTALPISLDCTLDARKVKPGKSISGTIAQDVPLGDRGKIRDGSHVTGHVVDVGRRADGSSWIRIRFDQLRAKHWGDVPIVTSLRTMATPWEVQEAQLPKVGPMINPNPASWTLYQVGSGDMVLRGGGPVIYNHQNVGVPLQGGGVLARLISLDQPGCRFQRPSPLQAVWVFGTAACGPYGFDDLEVRHAGDAEPLGEIVFESEKNVHVPTGTGMLLISTQPRTTLVASSERH